VAGKRRKGFLRASASTKKSSASGEREDTELTTAEGGGGSTLGETGENACLPFGELGASIPNEEESFQSERRNQSAARLGKEKSREVDMRELGEDQNITVLRHGREGIRNGVQGKRKEMYLGGRKENASGRWRRGEVAESL